MAGSFYRLARLKQLSLLAVLFLSWLVPAAPVMARCYNPVAIASRFDEQLKEEQALTEKTAYTAFLREGSGRQIGLLRWYDPNLQRWINRDPIGEAGGLNLYRFNYNDPVNYIDPNGKNPILVAIIAYAIYNALLTPQTVNAPGPGDPTFGPYNPEEIAANGFYGGLFGGALGTLDSALMPPISIRPSTCPVSRWGRPGLQSGDWVMEGPPSKWNYMMSGKWEQTPFNQFAPFESGQTFQVPPDTIRWPSGGNFFKGLPPFNQRQYFGPSIPPSSGSIINAPPTGPL